MQPNSKLDKVKKSGNFNNWTILTNFKIWNHFNLIKHNVIPLFIVLVSCILLLSCESFISNKGMVTVKNGKNKDISIAYECTNCKENSIDKQTFTNIINEITNSAKNNLQYPLSFVPSNITLSIDSANNLKYYSSEMKVGKVIRVQSAIYYTAKNGFGNEIDGKDEDFFYVRKGFVDRKLPKQIELTPIKIEKGLHGSTYVNRKLFASNENYEYVQISPDIKFSQDGFYLIVKSSLENNENGTSLIFSFLYGEKAYDNNLVIESSNESNDSDKTISYFYLTKEQVEVLKNNKIGGVRIKNYTDSFYCPIDKNLETYFIEYFSLREVKQVVQKLKND